jgi:hypothetical protein
MLSIGVMAIKQLDLYTVCGCGKEQCQGDKERGNTQFVHDVRLGSDV